MEQPLPASQTKHLSNLSHVLPPPNQHISLSLKQISSSSEGGSTGTTGTTLWLSSQILSLYLSSILSSSSPSSVASINASDKIKTKKIILELGGGIGYSSLNLLSIGYKVITTDIEPVLSDVLKPNLNNGIRTLRNNGFKIDDDDLEVRELDWFKVGSLYDQLELSRNVDYHDEIKSTIESDGLGWLNDFRINGLDLIIMSDTFYSPELIKPLWKSLLYISIISSSPSSQRKPPIIYIGLERRDSILIDQALEEGKKFNFDLRKIGKGRLNKEIQSTWSNWVGDDWMDVEVWKCRWKGSI